MKERPFEDLTGQRFGKLVVQGLSHKKGNRRFWNVTCDCGTKKVVERGEIKKGTTRSCGCLRRIDLSGQRFGIVTVLREAERSKAQRRWIVKCDCGTESIVQGGNLVSGHTKSCGCLKDGSHHVTHGRSRSREHRVWEAMLRRCRKETDAAYYRYGGRGITVCERWHSFESFFEDMGECPDGMTIDREDNDGNYEPGNCRWATDYQQARNKSSNVMLTFNGETLCLTDWARKLNVSAGTIDGRLRLGWTVEDALTRGRKRTSEKYLGEL